MENTGSSGTRVVVSVVEGEFDGLAQVISFTKDLASTGEVWIGTIWPSGNIGLALTPFTTQIKADRIGVLRTSADLTAEVIAYGTAISGQTVAIDEIDVEGDMLNSVTALEDEINMIDVEGKIGSSGSPVSISAKRDIFHIQAGAIYADITSIADSGNGVLSILETTAESPNNGDFVGSLTVDGIEPSVPDAITINGHLDADITVTSAALQSFIIVNKSFDSDRTIWLKAASGLHSNGQIVFNRDDDSETWDGTVKVGTSSPITITADPDYTNTAASLGGGAIGEAPFALHDESCTVANGGNWSLNTLDLTSIEIPPPCIDNPLYAKLRFYGSIELDDGHDPDYVIRVEKKTGPSTWSDVTSAFSFSVTGSRDRELRFWPTAGPDAWETTEYRVTPYPDDDIDPDRVRCKDVGDDTSLTVAGPPVRDFEYHISFDEEGCDEMLLAMYNMNGDGTLCCHDIAEWALSPVDLNDDESADNEDLDILMEAIDRYNQ